MYKLTVFPVCCFMRHCHSGPRGIRACVRVFFYARARVSLSLSFVSVAVSRAVTGYIFSGFFTVMLLHFSVLDVPRTRDGVTYVWCVRADTTGI